MNQEEGRVTISPSRHTCLTGVVIPQARGWLAVLVTRNPFAEIATVEDWRCTGIVKCLQDDDDPLLTRGASSLLKLAREAS